MNDVAPLLVLFGLGVLICGAGVLVYAGKGARIGPDRLGGRPAAMISGGLVLVFLSAAVAADVAGVDALVRVCLAAAVVLSLIAASVGVFGAPRWAWPSWQREQDRH
jgi:hypothetical protein